MSYADPVTDQNALDRLRLSRMQPRDPHEPHRTASTLELFFDLVFVVAISGIRFVQSDEIPFAHARHPLE